jgi:putative PEP-CTERM system TPR-repeat lipoprotein
MHRRLMSRVPLLVVLGCGAIGLSGCEFFTDAKTRVARAEQLIAQQDHRAAMIELKNALQSDEANARARLLLAKVSFQLGDIPGAEKELQRAIQLGASPADTAQLLAEIRLAQGDLQGLLVQIDAGELELPPDELATLRGRVLLGQQRVEPALEAFRAALGHNPENVDARIAMAEALAAEGKSAEGLALLEETLAAAPDSALAMMVKGGILVRGGQYDEARAALDKAREHAASLNARQQAALFALLGEAQLAQGDLVAAKDTYGRLNALTPNAPMTAMFGARIAMAEQNYAVASSELQKVVTAAPHFAPARFLLGAALFAQGNLHQAQTHLQRSLELAPENLQARKLLAKVHLQLSRPDAAMAVLLPAEQEDGVDALLGLARLRAGDSAAGVALLEQSLAEHPNDEDVQLELAYAYLRHGQAAKSLELARRLPRQAGDARRDELLIAAAGAAGGVSAARAEVERLLKQFPDDVDALSAGALFYARQGEFDRARELLGRAVRAQPDNTAVLFNRARVDAAEGKWDAVAGSLEQIVRIDGMNVMARVGLAELALRRNDAARAIALLEQLRKDVPDAIEPQLKLAGVYFDQRRTAQAEAALRQMISQAKGRPEVLNAAGEIYLEHEQHTQALGQFRAAVQLAPQHAGYWFNSARAQLALGNAAAAREVLNKTLELRADWVPAVGTLAMLDLREGQRAAALQRVADLKKRNPRDPSALTLEGDLYFVLQRYADAAKAYDAAGTLRQSSALAMKSYRARRAGKLADPGQPLRRWLDRQPTDLPVRLILAEAYQDAGQRLKAIEEYEVIVRQSANNAVALNNLAWLYHLEGDARAEDVARRAYEIAPNAAAIADTYAWILVGKGRASEARDILKSAIGSDPAAQVPPEVQYHYASALAITGDKAEARRVLQKLLEKPEDFAEREAALRLLKDLSDS